MASFWLRYTLFFNPQELNVRQLTLSTDKDKYGIRLRAEPDHMVLGKRLKGAFKAVTASIKELTNEHLETFQKTGEFLGWEESKKKKKKIKMVKPLCVQTFFFL